MNKNKLNILIINSNSQYDKFFLSNFNCELITEKDNINPDIVVFTGGEDVSPNFYNEETGKYTHSNIERDIIEDGIFNKYKRKGCLFIGICRGAQFLTVMNNGKLIQHVEGHSVSKTHPIMDYSTSTYNMTSTHHQMMYPFNLDKKQYKLIAWSKYFRSETYLDGTNNEIELDLEFLEPEIVFYPDTKSLCIQGHPEYPICPQDTVKYIVDLINHYLTKTIF